MRESVEGEKLILMLSRLRHIGKILLVALLVMSCTSCTRWREAKEVIMEAERLDSKVIIIGDTAALAKTIRTLGSLGRVFAHDDLAKAYYYLGRNFHNMNDYSTAADYYIVCDRISPTDPIYKGRVNSCMGFLCKQDSCFKESLIFYERANEAFKKSGNERRYANGLVSIAEQYVCLHEYAKADSVLQIASSYDIDSAYYADIIDIKALALYNQEMYDSALVHLLSIKDYPRPLEAKCYNQMNIMRSYAHLEKYELAVKYANYILLHTNNPNYRTNAYYCLLKYEEINKNIDKLAKYSYLRKDEDRYSRNKAESYAQASDKLKIYLENPYPHRKLYIIIVCSALVVVVLFWIIYVLIKRHRCALQKRDEEKQVRRDLLARRIYDHSVYFTSWQNYKKLRELANSHFNNMCYQLEDTYHLSEQEIKICLMVLLEYTNKQMAEILLVQPNTISKAKNKIAKQLNTSSAELRTSLIDIIA